MSLKNAIILYIGRVAQLGERLVRNEEVVGSIPVTSTFHFIHKPPLLHGGLSFK